MDILPRGQQQALLDYLPQIRHSIKEWQMVEVRLLDPVLKIDEAAVLVQSLFREQEGKILPCNDHELLMIVRWGARGDSAQIPKRIEEKAPGTCQTVVHELSAGGLQKIEILIRQKKPSAAADFSAIRAARQENVVLVADDDMYMRLLVKKGVPAGTTVHEVAHGNEIITAYKNLAPDVMFLDIHLPGRSGMDALAEIKELDPESYVVMLSADSSRDNVALAMQEGARNFMAKPFTKEKLIEHLKKCPTFK